MKSRSDKAKDVRYSAADLAYHRPHPRHVSSGDEIRLRFAEEPATVLTKKRIGQISLINSFTKGFEHDDEGFVLDTAWFEEFIRACDSGNIDEIARLHLNTNYNWKCKLAGHGAPATTAKAKVRGWESMGSGQTYDLEGPDAQAVTIPPAPRLGSDEITAEIAELYWMALCRDIPFTAFGTHEKIGKAISHLNALNWFKNDECCHLQAYEKNRKRGMFDASTIFRGNVKGDDCGFYISQFLYAGSKSLGKSNIGFGENQGLIGYGSITIDQRVRVATPNKDYVTNWEQWLDTQNGADLRGLETYVDVQNDNNIDREIGYRFITTPRDLATWVHYDALHEAYFNAALLLLGIKAPFDPGIPFVDADSIDKQIGFATFGGPHILNLVSEVATRALKAVRYQKYSVHRRARPEQIGGWIHRHKANQKLNLGAMQKTMDTFSTAAGVELMELVKTHNQQQNAMSDRNTDQSVIDGHHHWLMPMAFAEGSPMHPSYGSGHATVAGACVTILKAFFDSGFVLPYHFKPGPDGRNLVEDESCKGLYTVETELNKLASNIAIGRNWGGVHWYSDQIESLRLGEQIALGILEEQKLTYGENFSMSVPLFDGSVIRI